jgi:putative endonuclease
MATHNQLGKEGEEMAADYLVKKGYALLHRNWRYGQNEIDIIARKDAVLHFVEVKLRTTNKFGYPEESVTKQKIRFLMRAADQFLFLNPQYKNICFDILSITAPTDATPEFFFIEDVYL